MPVIVAMVTMAVLATPSASTSGVGALLGGEDGLLDPVLVGLHLGVDARHVTAAAPDAEANNAHLIPLAVFLTHQRTSSIALEVN